MLFRKITELLRENYLTAYRKVSGTVGKGIAIFYSFKHFCTLFLVHSLFVVISEKLGTYKFMSGTKPILLVRTDRVQNDTNVNQEHGQTDSAEGDEDAQVHDIREHTWNQMVG